MGKDHNRVRAGMRGWSRPSPGARRKLFSTRRWGTEFHRRTRVGLSRAFQSLAAGQHQQLGVGGQDFAHGLLKLAARLHAAADLFDLVLLGHKLNNL